jgi:hypothetical protein
MDQRLMFIVEPVTARFIAPEGKEMERTIEIRTNPITFRASRVTLSRIGEKEKGTETLPVFPLPMPTGRQIVPSAGPR